MESALLPPELSVGVVGQRVPDPLLEGLAVGLGPGLVQGDLDRRRLREAKLGEERRTSLRDFRRQETAPVEQKAPSRSPGQLADESAVVVADDAVDGGALRRRGFGAHSRRHEAAVRVKELGKTEPQARLEEGPEPPRPPRRMALVHLLPKRLDVGTCSPLATLAARTVDESIPVPRRTRDEDRMGLPTRLVGPDEQADTSAMELETREAVRGHRGRAFYRGSGSAPSRLGPRGTIPSMTDLVVTLIGPDHPGIVDSVAEAVACHGGNWLESRMAHLAGKFAGILRIEVADGSRAGLEAALRALESKGLSLVVETSRATADVRRALEIELLGQDRPGLVRQISDILARRRINVEELVTDRFSAPMSGELLFRARLKVDVPAVVDVADLRQALEQLAADLMVEVRVAEAMGQKSALR